MNEELSDTALPQDILSDFRFTTNIELIGELDKMGLNAYRPGDITDEEALQVVHAKAPDTDLQVLVDEYGREGLIEEGRGAYREEGIGGVGITARSLEQVEEVIPGVSEALLSERGRIVFLGNGFSTAPAEIVRRRQEQAAQEPLPEIVIVDIFDYQAAFDDLTRLAQQLAETGQQLPPSIAVSYEACRSLIEEIQNGTITAVQHIVGDGETPDAMTNAALMVNCFGPPASTSAAQLACLRRGGRLYTQRRNVPPIEGVEVTPLTPRGTVLTRM